MLNEPIAQIEDLELEAEILWGKEMKNAINDFKKLINLYTSSLKTYLHRLDEFKLETDAYFDSMPIVLDDVNPPSKDKYNLDLEAAVERIESIIRTKIKDQNPSQNPPQISNKWWERLQTPIKKAKKDS